VDSKKLRIVWSHVGQRFFAVEPTAALAWVNVMSEDRFVRVGPNTYRLFDSGSTASYLIPDRLMEDTGEWIVRCGDRVHIEAQGVERAGVVEYVCKDGEYWLIEMVDERAPISQRCIYWKQRHDGGRIVSVVSGREVANG